MNIKDYLTITNFTDRNDVGRIKYIVIHYTAGTVDNGTAALANAKYFYSEYRGASAHYFVDCGDTIYRVVKDEDVAWHCGTSGTYYHKYCRNSNSIGIEICSYYENGTYKFKPKAVETAVELTKYLMKKYGVSVDNVVMHYHVTHKICAAPFMSNGKPSEAWDDFKRRLTAVTPTAADRLTDIKDHYAEAHIKKLVNYDVINGYEDNTFKPENPITRAEYAVMVAKALENACGYKLDTSYAFTDIDGHFAADSIAKVCACGIINGFEDRTYRPDEYITREQAAMITANFLLYCGLTLKEVGRAFPDTATSYADIHIQTLQYYGIVNGYEDGEFKPKLNVTRGQAAIMLANALTVVGK